MNNSQAPSKKDKKQALDQPKVLPLVIAVVVWIAIVAGAGYFIKDYIDRSIQSVQQTNAMHVQTLEDRLSALGAEMEEIKYALQDTDQTLASSDSTQRVLNDKIEELDRQLKDLERSLNVLKEAP
ncbi:hypothetical protein [Desulfofalx alkaliphila]|uniref:hypothetical protein n=1 Tax=Desulfofalx alkaliphila TaxID=105483 RepID=UPI0004E1EEDD|nr:hypothetical protein [Desulfofalx alkaliphila]